MPAFAGMTNLHFAEKRGSETIPERESNLPIAAYLNISLNFLLQLSNSSLLGRRITTI